MAATKDYKFLGGRPMIPITICNPTTGAEVSVMGLIDTGADSCMFPGFIATAIGYDLKAGKEDSGTAAGGHKLVTWSHKVTIHVNHPDTDKRHVKLLNCPVCDVAFAEHDGTPLLGATNFLYTFQNITLLYKLQIARLTIK